MASEGVRQRAFDRISELAARNQDLVTLWNEATEALRPAVPHYWHPCWYTLDPASLLITSHYQRELARFPPEFLAHEYLEDDVNKLADVARSESGLSTLHEATGGEPSRSPRWHSNMKLGGDQELIAALRTERGEVWGAMGLYREPDSPLFDAEEIALIKAVAPKLAVGARTGLLVGEATDPEWPDSPGLVVIADGGEVESVTEGVERWLAELPDGDWQAGVLPSAVRAVGAEVLAGGSSRRTVSRVRSRSGTWIVLHGAPLVSDGARRAAVIVEPAHPARITPLLMAAYGLSDREQEVTRLVLQGDSTAQIAATLGVSPHTVQDHLKKVFDKTGVSSRRELTGKIFFSHYEPRFRDNEDRILAERPARGEPYPAS